jgi:DNA-binding PadR family transcriptional regulator
MSARSISFRQFVLGMLAQQPMSGYDIKRRLKNLAWLIGDMSFGSLYPALHALLNDGLVTVSVTASRDKPPRKVYSVSEAGKTALEEWANQSELSNTSLKGFVMRLNMASTLSQPALVRQLKQRREQVSAHHTTIQQQLDALDNETDLGRHLVMSYGLTLASAELAWLDEALARLAQPPLAVEGRTNHRVS